MENLDDEIRLEVRTKSDRPVLNTPATPEYVNLATHFNEDKSSLDKYESLQFTENSTAYIDTFEDEALLRGEVKPKVVKTSVKPKVPSYEVNTTAKAGGVFDPNKTSDVLRTTNSSPEIYTSNNASRATADGKVVYPYQDIPGVFASIDTLNPEIKKEERYFTVPSSLAIFYNPLFLTITSLVLVLLIVGELIGLVYVF